MERKDQLLQQSQAIRTFPIQKVKLLCDVFSLIEHDEVRHFESNITEWLKPIIDLTDFSYLYPINGITEGLNYWLMQEKRKVKTKIDDYAWVRQSDTGEVMYISCPSSIDGNYCDIPTDMPVVLDIAHVGSTSIQKIKISNNVEKVFFSLSKCFGLRNYRIGYYWSKTPDILLDKLVGSGKYYNYHSMQLGESIINQVQLHEVHDELFTHQHKICDDLNLTPSDSVWLATTQNNDYDKFKRGSTNRINISELIKEDYYDQTISK